MHAFPLPAPDVPRDGPAALHDLPAPAKINTFLHVVGRRPDGYHLLQSLMLLVDWSDRLHLQRRDDGRLDRLDLGPALPADDLALRAARALREASGTPFGASIALDKQVPWGAGLGGGSSDAATVLIALNRLWGLHWPRARLAELALRLGADVPFFLDGRPSLVEGIGEELTPLPQGLAREWFAIVKPPPAVPTAAVYGSPLLRRDTERVIVEGLMAEARRSGVLPLAFGRNDLQPVAETLCAEVPEAIRWLQAAVNAPGARMSGSGSAVFAPLGRGSLPVATWPSEGLPSSWVGRIVRNLECHPLASWLPG